MLARGPREFVAAAVLWAVIGPLSAWAAQPPPMSGPARCRFAVPEGWSERDVRWSGPCRAGRAQGRGAMRAYESGKVSRAFYGTLKSGQPVLGVIDQPDGFVAGRFEQGKVVNDGERNTLIQAFDDASAAARQVAEGYRKAGNAPSARFYEDKAKQLANQLD